MASICTAFKTSLLKITVIIAAIDLQTEAKGEAIGKFSAGDFTMRFSQQTFEDQVTLRYCPTCHGARKLACTACKGRLADAQGHCCAKCLGSGRMKCVMCDGEGRIKL